MAKLSTLLLLLLLLLLGSLCSFGQSPPDLDFYVSKDNSFSFAYPDTYDLLEGEGILKRTQGAHVGISVCDFLTAYACIVYPNDNLEHSTFEAAAFSVNGIVVTSEHSCLEFADQLPRAHGEHLAIESIHLNGQLFRHTSTKTTATGHSQSTQRYRSFHKGQCYELRIAVSLSDVALSPSASKEVSVNKDAEKALRSLERVLSSFVFAD